MRSRAIGAALFVALAALLVQSTALPGTVFACSCPENPPSLADVAAESNPTVITGTVGLPLADRTPILVDTWFHGAGPTDALWVSGGTQMIDSCNPGLTAGERRVLVLFGDPGAVYSVAACTGVGGVLGTPAGDAGLAEVLSAFGEGQPIEQAQPPPTPTATPDAAAPAPPATGASSDGMLWVVAGLVAAVVVFGAVVGFARVRQRR